MKSNQTPANKRRVPTKKKTTIVKSKHAPKELEEKFAIKHEIAVRLRRGASRNQVAESLIKDGFNVSAPTVYSYAKQIHDEWVKFKNESYDLHVSRQLAMLDEMISECWEILKESKKDKVITQTNTSFSESGEQEELLSDEGDVQKIGFKTPSDENPKGGRTKIRRVGNESEGSDENPKGRRQLKSEIVKTTNREGDVEVLKMLERFWVRRCEILGISANTTINIQNNQFNETTNVQANIHKPISNQFFRSVVIQEDVRKGIQEADAEIIEDNQHEN